MKISNKVKSRKDMFIGYRVKSKCWFLSFYGYNTQNSNNIFSTLSWNISYFCPGSWNASYSWAIK